MIAGPLDRLAKPGDHIVCRAAHVPILITRGRDGELRGFVNVCRHRGFVVAEGEGRRETLQCPYHAWTYGLDGSLRAAPRSEEEPDFYSTALPKGSLVFRCPACPINLIPEPKS